MISVKVTYTVKLDFVNQNKKNIKKFLEDFRNLPGQFNYDVYLMADGVTFLHVSSYQNKDVQQTVLNTPSFVEFQKERDLSGLNGTHTVEMIEQVGKI